MRLALTALILTILWTGSALAQPFAYITNEGGNNVTVINTATNTLVGSAIPVENFPNSIAITPDGGFVYAANGGSASVSVIDASTNTVTATVTVGSGPGGIAITPDGNFLYVANQSDNNVSVIDTSTNTVVGSPIGVQVAPTGAAASPDGNFVYVTNFTSGTVSVIATSTNTVVDTVTVGAGPASVAVSPDGSRVYTASNGFGPGSVSVIDTSTNTVAATVTVGTQPRGVAVTPDGNFVYATNAASGTVSVIRTSDNMVIDTITVQTLPQGVDVTPDGDFVYVANQGPGTVSVIDTLTNTVVDTISVGNVSWGPSAFGKFIGPDPAPDLSVVKSGFPDPVVVGESLAYTIFVVNFEPGIGTSGVTLTDTLPSDVTFVSAVSDQGSCSEAAGVVTCDIGTMGEGDIVQVDIIVTAPSTTGAILNIADVTSKFPDLNPDDNHTEIITQITNAPVPPQTSELLIIKSDTPDPVVVGTPLTYNLFIANLGPDDATGVVVTDTLPPSVTFDSAAGCTEAAGVVTCNVGALASGGVLSFAVNVTPNLTGVIFNLAQVAGDQLDPAPGNNVAGETTTVVDVPVVIPMADLFVQKTDTPDPVVVGDNLTYTIFVTNFGPDTAANVTLTDTLPQNTTFVSAPGCIEAGGTVTCDLGDLEDTENAIVTVTVTPDVVETIFNIAEVNSDTEDPNPFNNISVESTSVFAEPIVIPKADLQVIKSDTPDPVIVNTTLGYQIVAINSGPDDATGVVVTDTLPPGVTFVSATPQQGSCGQAGGVVTCNLGTLPSGMFTQIDISVIPNNTGAIVNIAQIAGNEFDPTSSNNISTATTDVNPRPVVPPPPGGGGDQPGSDLFITKFASPSPAVQGEQLNYTVSIGNLGPLDANGVTLLDILPVGVTFVSANSSQGSCTELNGIVTCNLGNLPDIGEGIIAVIDIVVIPEGTGSIVNTAATSADQEDPNTSNNAATVIVQVNSGTTNPNPTPTQTPTDPGGSDGDSGGSSSSGCSLLAGNPNGGDSAFDLGLLLLPLLIIGLRAARRKK